MALQAIGSWRCLGATIDQIEELSAKRPIIDGLLSIDMSISLEILNSPGEKVSKRFAADLINSHLEFRITARCLVRLAHSSGYSSPLFGTGNRYGI